MPSSSDRKLFALVDYFGGRVDKTVLKKVFFENGSDYWKARNAVEELLGWKFIDLSLPYIMRNSEFRQDKLKFEGEVQQLHQEMFACEDEQRRIELAEKINQMVIERNYEVQYSEHYYDLHYMVLSGAVWFAKNVIRWTRQEYSPGQVVLFETGCGNRSPTTGNSMHNVLYRALSPLEGVQIAYLRSNPGVIVATVY